MPPRRSTLGGVRIRPLTTLALAALLALSFSPAASSSHWSGCAMATTEPTERYDLPYMTIYVVVRETELVHVWVYSESNRIPGLQQRTECGHLADNMMFEACGSVSTRIPGTMACMIETYS